jgi:hypothetical protein
MSDEEDKFLRENLICREYEVLLADGRKARIVFTLARSGTDTAAARIARQSNAKAHGLVFILDYPDVRPRAVVWLETDVEFALCAAAEDGDLGDGLKHFVVEMAGRFFEDVAEISLINSTRYSYSAPDPASAVRRSVWSLGRGDWAAASVIPGVMLKSSWSLL